MTLLIFIPVVIILLAATFWVGRKAYYWIYNEWLARHSVVYDHREMETITGVEAIARQEQRWADGEDDDLDDDWIVKDKIPRADRLPWYRGWEFVTYSRNYPQEAPRWMEKRYIHMDDHPSQFVK